MSVACNNVYGSICHFQCNKGFKLKGSVVRSCNKTSGANQVYWTGNATQCEGKLKKLAKICLSISLVHNREDHSSLDHSTFLAI